MTEKVNAKTNKEFLLGYYRAIQDVKDVAGIDDELNGVVWHLRKKARQRSFDQNLLDLPTYNDGYEDAYTNEIPAKLIYENDPDYLKGYYDGTDKLIGKYDRGDS